MKSGVLAAAAEPVDMKEVVHYCHCCGLDSHSEADRLEARGTCCQESRQLHALDSPCRSYTGLTTQFNVIDYTSVTNSTLDQQQTAVARQKKGVQMPCGEGGAGPRRVVWFYSLE
jgi:hypothetical protein